MDCDALEDDDDDEGDAEDDDDAAGAALAGMGLRHDYMGKEIFKKCIVMLLQHFLGKGGGRNSDQE